jgi:lysylphosphatidylglycerol synthetase-like protein (DUF2156 family)
MTEKGGQGIGLGVDVGHDRAAVIAPQCVLDASKRFPIDVCQVIRVSYARSNYFPWRLMMASAWFPSRALLALLLIVSAGVFTLGVAIERSTVVQTTAAESSPAAPASKAAQSSVEQGSGHAAKHGAISPETNSENLFGFNTESTGLVVAVIVVSLALAAAVRYWRTTNVLALALLFASGAGIFDIREVVHQAQESRGILVAFASVTALSHGAAVLVAVLLVRNAFRPTDLRALDATHPI